MSPDAIDSQRGDLVETLVLVAALAGIALGGLGWALGSDALRVYAWAAVTALVLLRTVIEAVVALARKKLGVDVIAVLAMGGALLLGEWLAGAIIAVMVTGGASLERYAAGRARRELSALLERAPRRAHVFREEGVVDVDPNEIRVGDHLLVAQGEVVPADGVLVSEAAVLDASALTGETRPLEVEKGDAIQSGALNAAGPLEMVATATAEASTYAAIVRLVREASAARPPSARLADRFALFFLIATLVLAGGAWVVAGDPHRALAVVVVATPCPLILAVPIAIVAGISRAARYGVIVKGGAALETLARARVLLLDKTGTITTGRPRVSSIETFGDASPEAILRWAASVEQVSSHPFAPGIVAAARAWKLSLPFPEDARDVVGRGARGHVDGRLITVGQLAFVAPDAVRSPAARELEMRCSIEGTSPVFVAVDGHLEGALVVKDPIRPEVPRVLRALRKEGISRIYMVTGDHPDVAELVGDAVGVDRVLSERTPEEKVTVVREARAHGTTMMAGDGINDAPALALADVGVAMGSRGATAAAEAADVVLTSDKLEGLLIAIRTAKRSRRIASQSAFVGIGASVVAMLVAAAGYLTPVAGALLQEGIDLAVILNALRALGGDRRIKADRRANEALAERLRNRHRELIPRVEALASLAARLDAMSPDEARAALQETRAFLRDELIPHEQDEERVAYPAVAALLPEEDPTPALLQTHRELTRLTRLFSRLVDRVSNGADPKTELRDLRRILYGLHAILLLHFAQEDELWAVLEHEAD